MTMSDDSRIDDLLDEWDDAQEQGREISLDELCRDCPELRGELESRIHQLSWADRMLDTPTEEPTSDGSASHVPKLLGRYRLIKLIGQGGFGQVWRAYDPELERIVAIKVLRPEKLRSHSHAELVVNEARKLARFGHPNIIPIHDVGREGDYAYMVTTLIEGVNLAEYMESKQIGPHDAVRIIAKIADALEHAHHHGVIHRDVKPHNILIDGNGEPFITDFGISVTRAEAVDEDTAISGTPSYMSPEQADPQGVVDARSDIFSLGVVLYELIVGQLPYKSTAVVKYWQTRDMPVAASPRSMLPKDLSQVSDVCMKALSINPKKRWTSAKQLREHLLASVPEETTPPTGRDPGGGRRPVSTIFSRLFLFVMSVLLCVVATVAVYLFWSGESTGGPIEEPPVAHLGAVLPINGLSIRPTQIAKESTESSETVVFDFQVTNSTAVEDFSVSPIGSVKDNFGNNCNVVMELVPEEASKPENQEDGFVGTVRNYYNAAVQALTEAWNGKVPTLGPGKTLRFRIHATPASAEARGYTCYVDMSVERQGKEAKAVTWRMVMPSAEEQGRQH